MIEAPASIEDMTLNISQEIHVKAPIDITFAALLDQLGPFNQTPDGAPMPFKLEAWPGGRWFRDLGDHNGHFWGNVQAIKRPSLLEINGPLFMSYPVANNLQYRLTEEAGETIIQFHHTGFGLIQDDHKRGVTGGWSSMHEQLRKRAEGSHR
ncbi:MAG TPA: SRPBCC domain-containing protein [Acidisarcina sp.]|nr:SRPBCC domain-containing protein [Acidisarcina sp.]